jgi:hypothetical protein
MMKSAIRILALVLTASPAAQPGQKGLESWNNGQRIKNSIPIRFARDLIYYWSWRAIHDCLVS